MPFSKLFALDGQQGDAPPHVIARPSLSLVGKQQIEMKPSAAKKCCGLCQPSPKGTAGEALIRTLEALAGVERFAPFKRELESAVEEIQNAELLDGIDDDELLVIEAVRLGFQWDKDISEYTGIERERVIYVAERLASEEPPRLVEEVQGGKTEVARGRRKRLWMEP